MKLALSTYSLWQWRAARKRSLEASLDWMAENGIKAVEFAGLEEKDESPASRARKLRRYCEKRKLTIAGLCVGAELLRPPAEQRKVIDHLKRQIDAAAELGVKSMRHDVTRGFGEHSKKLRIPQTLAGVLNAIVPAIRELADYGASKGIITTFENHGFYMQAADRCERLLKAVDHENFALTIDMGNFLCVNDDPVKAVARLAKYAVMAHVKDFHVRPKTTMPPTGWFATTTPIALRGAIVGHGVIDIPRQIQLLRKARYDGFLSLEFEGLEDAAKAVTLGMDYLKPLVTH
jgi:sugar phosphate isomerase/epimerase